MLVKSHDDSGSTAPRGLVCRPQKLLLADDHPAIVGMLKEAKENLNATECDLSSSSVRKWPEQHMKIAKDRGLSWWKPSQALL